MAAVHGMPFSPQVFLLGFMMTQSVPNRRDTERHQSSRQPVNQALNTLEIRGDYQAVIVPKRGVLSQRPGQAHSVRGRRDGGTVPLVFGERKGSLSTSFSVRMLAALQVRQIRLKQMFSKWHHYHKNTVNMELCMHLNMCISRLVRSNCRTF